MFFTEYLNIFLHWFTRKKKKKLEEEIKKKQLLHRSVSFPVYRKAWAGLAAHTPRTLSTPVPRELLIEPKE